MSVSSGCPRRLLLLVTIVWPCLTGIAVGGAQRPRAAPTTSFLDAVEMQMGGDAIAMAGHAAVRCFDWHGDRDLDLLVGDGEGRVWCFVNEAGADAPAAFTSREPVVAGDRAAWGRGYTGAVLHESYVINIKDRDRCSKQSFHNHLPLEAEICVNDYSKVILKL